MGRIAAIDYGLKRIGIALSDPGKKIALPYKTVAGGRQAVQEVKQALKEKDVEKIVLGLPLLMNGQKGDMAIAVEKFGAQLNEALHIPVIFRDERLSSKGADASLKEISLNRKQRSERMDETAAMLLLQSFLDETEREK